MTTFDKLAPGDWFYFGDVFGLKSNHVYQKRDAVSYFGGHQVYWIEPGQLDSLQVHPWCPDPAI